MRRVKRRQMTIYVIIEMGEGQRDNTPPSLFEEEEEGAV